MITKKSKYALIALLYLSRRYGEGPVLISDMAKQESIPKKFLEAILLEMKSRGILHSKKGKGGGYYLSKPPKEIMMGSVLRWIDGPLAPVPCVSKTAYEKCDECKDEVSCGIRLVMKEVRDSIAKILDSTSLEDVMQKTEKEPGSKTFMYYI